MKDNNEIEISEDAKIRVIYYGQNGIIKEDNFEPDAYFSDILKRFENKYKDEKKSLKPKYYLDSRLVEKDDRIIDLVEKGPNTILNDIEVQLEVNDELEIDDGNEKPMDRIIRPIFNPFYLIVFLVDKGIATMEEYPKEIYEKLCLNECDETYSHCNSPDSLFISGTSKTDQRTTNLFKISHKNLSVKRYILPISKSNHSMLYIPDKYLMLAGGDTEVCLVDLKNNECIIWAELSKAYERPGLFAFGNYVYCLGSLDNEKLFFEKTDISVKNNPKWEKVFPETKEFFFKNIGYGVSKCEKGKILISGGNNTGTKTYVYDINSNRLEETEGDDEAIPMDDKTFYKYNDEYSITLPSVFGKDPSLGVLNKKNKSLKKYDYDPVSSLKNIYKIKKYIDEKINEPGVIEIKAKYKEHIDESKEVIEGKKDLKNEINLRGKEIEKLRGGRKGRGNEKDKNKEGNENFENLITDPIKDKIDVVKKSKMKIPKKQFGDYNPSNFE